MVLQILISSIQSFSAIVSFRSNLIRISELPLKGKGEIRISLMVNSSRNDYYDFK